MSLSWPPSKHHEDMVRKSVSRLCCWDFASFSESPKQASTSTWGQRSPERESDESRLPKE